MTRSEKTIQVFKRTYWVMVNQTEGLTHADSLMQLPFRGNCLNWVLGHIIASRDTMLGLLGSKAIFSESEFELYDRDSEPIESGGEAVKLDDLLVKLKQSQDKLLKELESISPEMLEKRVDKDKEQTVGERIEFLQWHETYHVGQLEILRQLTGINDSII